MISSEADDLLAAAVKEWIGAYHEGIRAVPLYHDKSCVNFAHAAGCDDMQLPTECPRRLLCSFPLVGDFRTLRVNHQSDDGDVRDQLVQQLQLPGSQFSIEPADSCYVPARMAQTSNQTNQYGVGTAREDDRNRCGHAFGSQGRVIASDGGERECPHYRLRSIPFTAAANKSSRSLLIM